VALDGTASGQANLASALDLPSLSAADIAFLNTGGGAFPVNGTVDTIRLWDEDIAEDGLIESTS
jgi:hypothetical protein